MSDFPVQIRDARLEDVPQLQAFLAPFVAAKWLLPRSDEDLSILIRHGFVAQSGENNDILGFAAIEVYSKKLAEVQSLAVAPSVQGRGVGTELARRCVTRAKREGVLELMAITATENLFRTVGFDYSLPNQKRALFLQTRD